MIRIVFNSLFVAATVLACFSTLAAAQQTSSTDIFKATSPSLGDLDPSLIESELIDRTTNTVKQAVKTAAKPKQDGIFRPSTPVQSNEVIGQSNIGNNFNAGNRQPAIEQPIVNRNGFSRDVYSTDSFQQNTSQQNTSQQITNQQNRIQPESISQNNFRQNIQTSPPPAPAFFSQQPVGIVNGNISSQQVIRGLPVNNGTMIETRIAPTIQTQIMAPKSINVNQPADIFIQAQNIGQSGVKSVKLIAELPEHVKFAKSNPLPSNVNGQIYEFTLNNLGVQSKQIVKINLIPTAKLPLNISTQIKTESQQQLAVSVQQPVLDIAVSGPQAIQTGQTVRHTITVKNIGDGPAQNIRIKPLLPENLQIAANQKTLVPKLIPGQAAKFVLSSYARTAGESNVVFQVSAAGIESRESRSNLKIVRPELGVQLLGPSQNYLGRDGVYSIQLENTSELPIKNVDVTLQIPNGIKVNTISQQAKVDHVAGTLRWRFPSISGSQQQIIQFKGKAVKPGNQSFDVMVTSKDIGSKQMAIKTIVQGRPDLSIRLSDGGEPVGIGSKSDFTIEVSNHGSTIANSVNVQVQLPGALMAVNQEHYSIDPSGNYIQFGELNITPGKSKILKFRVVAVTEGEHIVRGSVSIQGSSQSISTENSIFVFEAQNAKVSEALTPDVRR